jgi:sulfur-carrier protein
LPMPLQIFLNATLRRFIPNYNPYEGLFLEVPPGASVSRVISDLGLPPEEVTLILVNGVRREPDFPLQGDERLGLFPPIGGG